MNKDRRRRINTIAKQVDTLKCILEGIQEEEENYRDTIPQNFKNSLMYEFSERACDKLYVAVSHLEEAFDCLLDAQDGITRRKV